MLQTKDLVRFRISFLRTEKWTDDCLIEHYTMDFTYHSDGGCAIGIWRAGQGDQHIATTEYGLWNLGDYLSRLPSHKGV